MNAKELKEKLQACFNPDEIEWRVGATNKDKTKGIVMAYVTNRAIINRLDDVCGIDGWQNVFKEFGTNAQICGISIKICDEWITKWDGASDTEFEAKKGGLSGAMKRAAVQWGIGRYLYKIPSPWVPIKMIGPKNFVPVNPPKLPQWAIPKDYKSKTPKIVWVEPTNDDTFEISDEVKKCLNSFKTLGVSQVDIENYLNLEAWMIRDEELSTLRDVYQQLKNETKTKADFFFVPKDETKQSAKSLNTSITTKPQQKKG